MTSRQNEVGARTSRTADVTGDDNHWLTAIHGWSQSDIARELGVTRQAIQKMLAG
jgi:DNA-binding transcriptional regulator LsrR (DeoR family)